MGKGKYEILGIGTPIVDYLVKVSHQHPETILGKKGGSTPIEPQELEALLEEEKINTVFITGGSTANTLKGLANLGHSCALIGSIGSDPAGVKFQERMEAHNIIPLLVQRKELTAQVACFVTPDSERTMRYFLGAGAHLSAGDLTPELFRGVKLVHIEGYLLHNQALVRKAMELASEAGALVSFDLASFEIAEKYKEIILSLLSEHVDIVFANDQETAYLTGLTPEPGCLLLKNLTKTAIVKMGSQGGWAAQGEEKIRYAAFSVDTVDTTGAGDLFASGFLHGHRRNRPLVECTRFGALVASHVVQILGAEIPPENWPLIKKALTNIA